MKKIIFLTMLCIAVLSSTVFAAPFESQGNGKKIMVGEVQCYGQYDLSSFVSILQDRVTDNMYEKSNKFNVVSGMPNPELMKKVHMNAIVRGHLYNRGTSGPELIRYANEVLGKGYRPTDAEVQAKLKQAGTPYSLSPEIKEALKSYAASEGVDYLLFANLNYVEVWLKNSIFSAKVADQFRGKSVTFNVEYYLVNAHTGMVFDNVSNKKTTAQQLNMIIVAGGKDMDMAMVISGILDKHVKEIIKNVSGSGFSSLSK